MKSTTVIMTPTWGRTLMALEEKKSIRLVKADTEKFKSILDAIGYKHETSEDGAFVRFTLISQLKNA